MAPTQARNSSEPWSVGNLAAAEKHLDALDIKANMDVKRRATEQQMPVIDMVALEMEDRPGSDCKVTSAYMARACETWGFFQLVNHGIDAALVEKVKKVSTGFFKESEERKLECKISPGVVEGYYSSSLTAVGSNNLTHSVDHLFYRTSPPSKVVLELWPRSPPAFRETMLEYTEQVRSLAERLICILSEELRLQRGALLDRMAGGGGEAVQSIRTNYYTPIPAVGCLHDSDDLCQLKAHSDPGGLTVLLQNDVAGFEVKKDGQWVGVEPMANALVVNIGDQIEILSNGRYKSIEHRGNAHRTKDRLSIATFLSPTLEAVIAPMEDLVNHTHPALYRSIKFQDYFTNFVVKGHNGKEHVRAAEGGVEEEHLRAAGVEISQ